jgi:hypothetical protein
MVEGLSLDELIAVTRDLPPSGTRRFLVMLVAEQDALLVSSDENLRGNFYMPEIGRIIAKPNPAQAPSALLDSSIARLVSKGTNLDRASAEGWANEIQD